MASPIVDCPHATSYPQKNKQRRSSISQLFRFSRSGNRRRASDDTLDMDDSVSACCYTDACDQSRCEGGCLKVLTQDESLKYTLDREATEAEVASDEDSSRLSPADERKVRFGELAFRTYEVMMVDNPGVSSGPPIGLSWKIQEENQIQVHLYESFRAPRRQRLDLSIPSFVRFEWLQEVGYSRCEIHRGMAAVRSIKARRQASVRGTPWEVAWRAIASVSHKVTKSKDPKKIQGQPCT